MSKKRNLCLQMMMVLSLAPLSFSVDAREFVTIIGPDGRPMVVPRMQETKKKTPVTQATATPEVQVNSIVVDPPVLSKTTAPSMLVQPVQPVQNMSVQTDAIQPVVSVSQPASKKASSAIFEVDGIEYVDSEYLEGKEFNLEGKKRFYSMPDGIVDKNMGPARMQTIEREKGVGQSVLKSLFQRPEQDTGPVVLASDYYRVSQQETVDSLGQQCFADKKLKKAKSIAIFKELNVWPRAPIVADEFDFELVQLKGDIQNIHIQSYAEKQNAPSFYWPFVVFLDHKGCVLEGAGGFKNQEAQGNRIQFSSIEGIIQIPAQSSYVLLTPLASAVDVADRNLTNYGQLKLKAIR